MVISLGGQEYTKGIGNLTLTADNNQPDSQSKGDACELYTSFQYSQQMLIEVDEVIGLVHQRTITPSEDSGEVLEFSQPW